MTSLLPSTNRFRTFLAYAAMLAATVFIYFQIRYRGEALEAPASPPGAAAGGAKTHTDVLLHVLLSLAAITLLARIVGGVFRRYLGQPPVIGEIVAGLMLGPSVLGAVSPAAYEFLLPTDSAPYLGLISKVGVVLFMFLVGLEIDPKLLRGRAYTTVAISHASIITPFILGASIALYLYPKYATSDVSFTVFSLFIAVSLSVTAFPVLARILLDRGVQHTPLGSTALACAAVGDVTAWTLLALVAGLAKAHLDVASWTIVMVAVYVGAMLVVVRPLLARVLARVQRPNEPISHTTLAVLFTALLLSAVATEWMGIHALFGAFLLGAIIPRQGTIAHEVRSRLEDAVLVLFLPSFFAFTGTRTHISLVNGAQDWFACALIIAAATAGKFGGTFVAARVTGIEWRKAAALGTLMNTRGLMELIALNLGLELGVITPTVFTMMVLMALVTTFTATPVLDLLIGKRGFGEAPEPAPRFVAPERPQSKP